MTNEPDTSTENVGPAFTKEDGSGTPGADCGVMGGGCMHEKEDIDPACCRLIRVDDEIIASANICCKCGQVIGYNWGEEAHRRWIETGEIEESRNG